MAVTVVLMVMEYLLLNRCTINSYSCLIDEFPGSKKSDEKVLAFHGYYTHSNALPER